MIAFSWYKERHLYIISRHFKMFTTVAKNIKQWQLNNGSRKVPEENLTNLWTETDSQNAQRIL